MSDSNSTRIRAILLFVSFFSVLSALAQEKPVSSCEIYKQLNKIAHTGSVLYIAAHPDDENTRLISYFSRGMGIRTGYLALTRGDGGQNLIGPEKGAAIGVLRTQELLTARSIDGGEQYFTRAVDFGFSKSAEESLQKWNEDSVLSDVVWVIRKFRPDVIITRFPPDSRAGHGHHIASAILAAKAFDMAGDPKAFPKQLKYVKPWSPLRLYWNTSSWWDKNLAEEAKNSSDYIEMDPGKYDPILGESYTEIAARSRSSHRSQGFGMAIPKGTEPEYLKYVKGKKADPAKGIFDGIDITWTRFWGGENIEKPLKEALNNYKLANPDKILPDLLAAKSAMAKLNRTPLIQKKLKELNQLILEASGIWIEAVTDHFSAVPGDSISLTISAIDRDTVPVTWKSFSLLGKTYSADSLAYNQLKSKKVGLVLPANTPISNPYWLNGLYTNLFPVHDQQLIGLAENKPVLNASFQFDVEGKTVDIEIPVRYKWVDHATGQKFRDFIAVPKLTTNYSSEVEVMAPLEKRQVELTVTAHKENVKQLLTFHVPAGWKVSPPSVQLDFETPGETRVIHLDILAPDTASIGDLTSTLADGDTLRSYQTVDYPHIEPQVIMRRARLKLVSARINCPVKKIAYIPGSGDDVAKSLQNLGIQVTEIAASDLLHTDLSKFQAIVTGIRAFNVDEGLANAHDELMKYVSNGGTLIVQYNKDRGLVTDSIGPYPFHISRDRVTEEKAVPTFLKPDSKIFQSPNKITMADFDNWVQERGTYFADQWDNHYTPLISWHDTGETPLKGSLLVTHYGKGAFIYTGITFFRQLPAGNPGAYKLFANLLSYGQ